MTVKKTVKIHNFEQRTPEWYNVRIGRFTGSDFHTCLGKSQTKDKMIFEKATEHITGKTSDEEHFVSADMQRGIDCEGIAREKYEGLYFVKVDQIGFAELDEWVGCSPDGLVGNDGIIEIKCPKSSIFVSQVISDKIKPEYMTQIQFNLYVLDRKWCDYIAYNENFELFVKRFYRDEEKIEEIKNALNEVIASAKGIIDKFNKIAIG